MPKYMLVYDQEWSAYVTNDLFGGGNVAYGPGLHITHWWERRNKEGNYALTIEAANLEIGVQTKDSKVTARVLFQYAPSLTYLTTFIGLDPDDLVHTITSFVESFLTQYVATLTAEQARANVADINRRLTRRFEANKEDPDTDIELKLGIIVVSLVLKGFSVPEAVQKSRDALDENINIRKGMAVLKGMTLEDFNTACRNGEVSKEEEEKLRGDAMASSENATLTINEVRTSGNGDLSKAAIANLATGNNGKKGK
jgi:regulator of protease activity HflC (stomatin/prohibitin superfamily)